MTNRPDTHGGNIYKEARSHGVRKEDFLDYSANINPLGVPESLKKIILSNLEGLVNYPDPECTELKEEIEKYLGVPFNRIIVGNGASEIIFLLFQVLHPKKVLIPAPTFSEYAKAAESYGVTVKYYERKEEKGFHLNAEELLEELEDGVEAILLCNPNNPTSTLMNKTELEKLVEQCSRRGISAIIDEAFIELTEDGNANSIVDLTGIHQNLFIIRAFTKYFAIPGLRLGYGIGSESMVRRMEERKVSWSVNSLAACSGKMLSLEREYMEKTALWLRAEKEWLFSQLRKIDRFKVFRPETNFILVKIVDSGLDAGSLKERMAEKGILIRHAGNFKFLNDKFFRVAVKDRTSNERFMQAIREVMKEWEG